MNYRWERRAAKLEAIRRRMKVTGRGLLTVEPYAILKTAKALQERNFKKSGRKRK